VSYNSNPIFRHFPVVFARCAHGVVVGIGQIKLNIALV